MKNSISFVLFLLLSACVLCSVWGGGRDHMIHGVPTTPRYRIICSGALAAQVSRSVKIGPYMIVTATKWD